MLNALWFLELSSLLVLSCDFDNATFCGWENDVTGRAQFLWQIWEGQTPSKRTGPLSDVSGNLIFVSRLTASIPNLHEISSRRVPAAYPL